MVKVLEFVFSDAWRFLGIVILMFIPATWHLFNVDTTIIVGKLDDVKKEAEDED